MAQALFRRLRQDDGACVIDVLAPGWSAPILARMPEVRRAIPLPAEHGEFAFRRRRALGRALRGSSFDHAIVLRNSWKSALVPYFARVPRRTGYAREFRYGLLNDLRRLDPSVLKTTVARFVALAETREPSESPAIPAPRLVADSVNAQTLREKLGLPTLRAVALMPGAEYGPAKRWPAEHFASLAKTMARDGIRSWVFGSQKEHALGEHIAQESEGAAINLCGRTGLGDVVDLLSSCWAAVTNDSGLMHVAAASGTPVVALFGSSSPDFTPPLTTRRRIHYLRLDCSPCFQRVCPFGHTNCLRLIDPASVRESVRGLAGI